MPWKKARGIVAHKRPPRKILSHVAVCVRACVSQFHLRMKPYSHRSLRPIVLTGHRLVNPFVHVPSTNNYTAVLGSFCIHGRCRSTNKTHLYLSAFKHCPLYRTRDPRSDSPDSIPSPLMRCCDRHRLIKFDWIRASCKPVVRRGDSVRLSASDQTGV